ncbi:hypothetical protein [Aquimarina brevivitae]|uniref:Uncharacterized protein n=1 Tax=Aquimarina brevivitae TaxID=323412 RepID=A0A4V2F4V6_9FLAO|nr:hypothetical protein [Aquimarina brevivitae]RZS90649.1 hypothetical protein EV197_3178 [Aquimarina brevivitae]
MKKDIIKIVFEKMHQQTDIYEPSVNHRDRFMEKLQRQNETKVVSLNKKRIQWYKPLAIAASIAILLGIISTSGVMTTKTAIDLASISPEMEQTQSFFVTTIANKMEEIQENASPENQKMVNDVLLQIEKLESDYQQLKIDLIESGQDPRVISAMIKNFQKRAQLLEDVLAKINTIKTLKQSENENYIL